MGLFSVLASGEESESVASSSACRCFPPRIIEGAAGTRGTASNTAFQSGLLPTISLVRLTCVEIAQRCPDDWQSENADIRGSSVYRASKRMPSLRRFEMTGRGGFAWPGISHIQN